MSVELEMPANRVIFYHSIFLLPSIFPSLEVFSNTSNICIMWPKYWSLSFSISPSNEYPRLVSFQIDPRLISSTTYQKHQFFYGQPSLWTNSQIPFLITSLTDYWKNHSLSIGSFVGNVILLLFNKPCSSIVTFFPRSSPLAAVPFSSDYSIKLQFPPPAATHTSYILVWDTCFENKTRPQMDGNVSKVWTDMRSQGREESTTLIVVGNVL